MAYISPTKALQHVDRLALWKQGRKANDWREAKRFVDAIATMLSKPPIPFQDDLFGVGT